ncbi:metal-dependent phosphohydrolase [Desulfonema ishimotonii]|uniref:5'-deoxynucleotidase n=1 Tax=Desulfonema ishimotonii TaxID=45657 RepID=A0A401FX53_9BACT|nr:HD domain-containing protein [Desulfonema ishimotonii]GBC61529.1 metal-dependent phosphohydrolase [Desulfonema ishimotonii]
MKSIADLLFEAKMLKEIPRSGYHFLGAGRESVAEHCFMITFIAYAMSEMEPDVDASRLIRMCIVHDLPEARIGDLNYVQKNYVTPHENRAVADTIRDVPFGNAIAELLAEFNAGETREARLAKDADQIAFILDLKALSDIGHTTPHKWLPVVLNRLQTETGKQLADNIMKTGWDEWWLKNYIDRPGGNQ